MREETFFSHLIKEKEKSNASDLVKNSIEITSSNERKKKIIEWYLKQ